VTTGQDDASTVGAQPRRDRRLPALVVALALTVVVVDQVTKAWALRALTEDHRIPLLGDLLGLQLVFNSGAALSIAEGMTWVLTLVALAVVVVVVRMSRRLGSPLWAFTLGLLLGGAVGNLVDRFARPPAPGRGHVVDFIAYGNVFVGNVADIAIVAAAGLVIIQTLRGVGLDGTRAAGHLTDDGSPDGGSPDDAAAHDGFTDDRSDDEAPVSRTADDETPAARTADDGSTP
jgi:signal peptidase II